MNYILGPNADQTLRVDLKEMILRFGTFNEPIHLDNSARFIISSVTNEQIRIGSGVLVWSEGRLALEKAEQIKKRPTQTPEEGQPPLKFRVIDKLGAGLANQENNCYANALIQVLNSFDSFNQKLMNLSNFDETMFEDFIVFSLCNVSLRRPL